VGFSVTHAPCRFPIEFRGLFDPDDFTVPEVGPEDAARIPPVFRGLDDGQKRWIIAAYYTSAAYMDRNVGLVLDALDRSGHADDTLVVFNSDHGYLLGQHGRFEKHRCCEDAVRSALLMRLPGVIAPGPATRLHDLADDPGELGDVARLPENQGVVERLIGVLAGHVRATGRAPARYRSRTTPARSWRTACRPVRPGPGAADEAGGRQAGMVTDPGGPCLGARI
jgi:hypothetical protein